MILKESKADVIVSGNFEETEFSIDGASDYIIFDMLRSKIYKNNIGAICREVASNSRDAQREIGDFTTPVEIEISDRRNHFFYEDGLNLIFRDRGVGISPERVKNIYTKYGASTKRTTNDQTGGFGLGAKTPFSYSDAFIVRTIVDKVEYVYSIYIDPSRKGKMALLFQEDVESEGNMTEIIIPIKAPDLQRFKDEIFKNTHFWKVRPKLISFKGEYPRFGKPDINLGNIPFEVPGEYAIIRKEGFIESNVNVIVDGIYYPVDMKILKFDFEMENFAICLYYENGELNIAANREMLQYDDPTIKSINDRVNKIFDVYKKEYTAAIDSQPDMFHAQIMYNKFRNGNHFFNVSCKGEKFFYKQQELMSDTWWCPETIKVYSLNHIKCDPTYKKDINNLFCDDLKENFGHCFYTSQKENVEHKKRLSIPISRTIFNGNSNKFILFSTLVPDDVSTYNFDQAQFDAAHAEDLKILADFGIVMNNYWEVAPEKITPEKKEKRETVIMKAFYGNGSYDRTKEMGYIDRYLYYHGKKLEKLYYFGVEDERKLPEKLKKQLQKVMSTIYEFDKDVVVCIASKVKRRFFKNYQPIEVYLESVKDQLVKFFEAEELEDVISEVSEYEKFPIKLEQSEDFKHLMKVKLVKNINCVEIKEFIRENMPKFEYNFNKASHYKNITADINKKYPYIETISNNKGAIEVGKYVRFMNRYYELERLESEKRKFDHFIN